MGRVRVEAEQEEGSQQFKDGDHDEEGEKQHGSAKQESTSYRLATPMHVTPHNHVILHQLHQFWPHRLRALSLTAGENKASEDNSHLATCPTRIQDKDDSLSADSIQNSI